MRSAQNSPKTIVCIQTCSSKTSHCKSISVFIGLEGTKEMIYLMICSTHGYMTYG